MFLKEMDETSDIATCNDEVRAISKPSVAKSQSDPKMDQCSNVFANQNTLPKSSYEPTNVTNVVQELAVRPQLRSVTNANCEQGRISDVDSTNEVPTSPVYELKLDNLPQEIFLHILSFLPARFVVRVLPLVCKYFHSVISDNTLWKIRIGRAFSGKYPAIPVKDGEFNWPDACIQLEETQWKWRDPLKNMDHFMFTEGFYAAVDVVHLMQNGNIAATGSRDRYINIFDLSKLDASRPDEVKHSKISSKMDAHLGWIWSMASVDNILATGSWDRYISFWDLDDGLVRKSAVRLKSAVLCLHYEPGFVAAGCYDKLVYFVDPRCSVITSIKKCHTKPVLCLQANDRFIVTGGEDSTVVVHDRRADRVLRNIQVDDYAMSLSLQRDELWLGDKKGALSLFDVTDGDFNFVQKYDIGHTGKVTGVQQTLGAIFTCSTDHSIKVIQPTATPKVTCTLTNHKADVARLSYQDGNLASAGSDVSVGIWKPKQ